MNLILTVLGCRLYQIKSPTLFTGNTFAFVSLAHSYASMINSDLSDEEQFTLDEFISRLSLEDNIRHSFLARTQCECEEPRDLLHCYLEPTAADPIEARFFLSGEAGFISYYCYCEKCLVCFWKPEKMGRTKGAPNNAPSRADMIRILKGVALLNDFGRVSDGTPMKDLTKGTLIDMITKAGLDNELQKELSKRSSASPTQQTQLSNKAHGKNVAEDIIDITTTTPMDLEMHEEDESDYEDTPLNQGSATATEGNQIHLLPDARKYNMDWIPELTTMGYNAGKILPPNKAVQTILGCIRNPEIHNHFIHHENRLREGGYSVIMYIGTNNMLALATKFREANYDSIACRALISDTYCRLPDAIYEATCFDSTNVQTYIRGLTVLEKANGVKITNPPLNRATIRPTPRPTTAVSLDTCLFDLNTLTEQEKSAILGINSSSSAAASSAEHDPADDYKLKQLNLANCSCYPIVSPRLVESLGQRHGQALWLSKNLGIIAPLSTETWILLAGIIPEELKQAYYEADNLIRSVDRLDVELPFNTGFFGKSCNKGDGFLMGQKDHMAKPEEKRNEFYIKKIWRTHCPYIKCNCQKFTRGKKDYLDGGIKWLDHAMWYFLNHLDAVWPQHSPTVRFSLFSAILRAAPMRTAIIAYIGYLRVRGILIDMTKRYAIDQTANLNLEFGNTKLTDVLEKTIRPIKFLLGKTPSGSNDNSANKRKLDSAEDDDSDIILPPSVFKKPGATNTPTGSNLVILSDTSSHNNTTEASVSKVDTALPPRSAGMKGNKITF